jgi:pimeloyl-ACP methyl ester carboxylesterase
MGGATALMLAGSQIPQTVAALVLVDVVPRIDPAGAAQIVAFMKQHAHGFASLEEAANAVAAYNPHRPRPRDAAGLIKNLRQRNDGRLYWHWDPRMLERTPEPPLFAERLTLAATRIRVPTLLVRGLQSDLVTAKGVADFKQYIPQLEVFDVAGAGHMVAGDKNDAFNSGVFAFLQRHMPSLRYGV